MDSKYNTPGALDNAVGILMLLEISKCLNSQKYTVEIVPFNGEEYYEASGEVAYLDYIKNKNELPSLVINIDSPCHIGARNAISFYNFDNYKDTAINILKNIPQIVEGLPWYAGDHIPFVGMGIPCVAISSSDLFEGGLEKTHTPFDTADNVDLSLIKPIVAYVQMIVDIL